MTIEEAIEHCKEIVTENRRCALEFARAYVYDAARHCQECATEHEQLAEWLTELKQRREAEITEPPKSNADRIRQMTDDEELLSAIGMSCYRCVYNNSGKCSCECNNGCYAGNLEWLRKEADEDATERTD